jgi:general secretion pathway protein J
MNMSRARGFTLLELVVAMAVLAVLGAISFRGLSSMLGADARVQAEMRRWTDLARVMEQLGRDLSLAVEQPVQEGASDLLVKRLGDSDGGPRQGGSRKVGYRLRNGTLQRLSWASLEPAPAAAPAVSAILDDVSALEWRALRPDGQWAPLGRVPGRGELAPRAVAAEIVLGSGERVRRIFPLP